MYIGENSSVPSNERALKSTLRVLELTACSAAWIRTLCIILRVISSENSSIPTTPQVLISYTASQRSRPLSPIILEKDVSSKFRPEHTTSFSRKPSRSWRKVKIFHFVLLQVPLTDVPDGCPQTLRNHFQKQPLSLFDSLVHC